MLPLLPGGPLLAQPTGCVSRYSTAGVEAGGAAGLYAEFYSGTFQTQPGFSEASPLTFFGTTPGQTATVTQVNFRNTTGAGYVSFPVTQPTAGGTAAVPTTFSARFRGSVYLQAGAPYTFYLNSDDGAYLFLGKEATLAAPTPDNAFIKNGIVHTDATIQRLFTAPADGLYDLQLVYGQDIAASVVRLDYSGGPGNLARTRVQTALCAGPSGRSYAANLAPTANDRTQTGNLFSAGIAYTLTPGFDGFDQDGTVDAYTIVSLPANGTLSYNVNATGAANYQPVVAPFMVTVANLGRLRYTSSNSQTAYTDLIQYRAVDNSGATSTNTATYTLPVRAPLIDLATTLGSPATAPQGSLVFFTATVTNNGPEASPATTVTITLPAGLTGISLSNSGTYNASTGRATFPAFNLNSGTTTTRSIAFSMPAQPVSGSATSVQAGYRDTNTNNDTGTAYTAPTQSADVSVAINGPTRVVTSQTVAYTVVTSNLGPSTATNVGVEARLPAGLSGVAVSDGGSYNTTNGRVTWPVVNTLGVGNFLAYTIRFNASATVGTVYTGTGLATSGTANGDPAPANNDGTNSTAQISTEVISTAAAATECVDPENPAAGFAAVPNTYYEGLGTLAAGSSSFSLGNILSSGSQQPLAPGDLLVVMQMQGAELNTADADTYGDGIDGNNVAAGNLQNNNFRAGIYEYGIVTSVSNGVVTLRTPLINSYVSSDATATMGQQRYQIIRVPRLTSLTLTGTVSGPRWNGRTGGVVVLDVNGTLNFNGQTIDMAGKGFRGGAGQVFGSNSGGISTTSYRHSSAVPTSANKGEGIAGTPRYVNDPDQFAAYRAGTAPKPFLDTQESGLLPAALADGYPNGDRSRGAPGNAGGGGLDGRPSANDQNTGGGGGGNAGRGGRGGNGWDSNSPTGGYGGADFTQATPSRIVMGGGGGAGTTNNGTIAAVGTYPANAGIPAAAATAPDGTSIGGFTSSGAAGGGIVLIRAGSVAGTGTINVNGASMPYVAANDGSGGAGAGGSVVLLANSSNGNAASPVLQNITVLADGGRGGSNTGGGSPHGPGGGGAGGIIFASSRLNAATSSNPGLNGTTFGFESYGSGVGAADLGQAQVGITRADVPNQLSGCPADIVTTLTTSTTSLAPGGSVTFTLTARNAGPGTGLNVVPTLTLVPNLPAGAFSDLGGGTYDAATGIVTFPATAQLLNGASLTYAVTFTMPAQTVLGQAASTADADQDPRTANNDGTSPNAQVRVEPLFTIAGRIFDDVNYGGGLGRNYTTAEASALNSGVPAGTSGVATGSAGTVVELYSNTGALVAATTSGPDGLYGFNNIVSSNGTTYTVRVVNSTVQPARQASAAGLLPVQTFRVSGGTDDLQRVGGEAPELEDAAANTGAQTLAALTASGRTAQSVATVTFGSTAQISGVDFGFNFSTIVSTRDAGQGSLRQFILNSNALSNLQLDQAAASSGGANPAAGVETSVFMIADGQARDGLRAGLSNQLTNGVARIVLNTAASGTLPALTDANTTLDARTQTQNVGNTNPTVLGTGGTVGGSVATATALGQVAGPEVELVGIAGQSGSDYGLTLSAANQSVAGFAIYGFGRSSGTTTGAGIYVTGNAQTGTVLSQNVLGSSATSFQAPAGGSPGSGIYLANFSTATLGSVSATITNNLIGFHGGSGIENLASGSPTTLLITNNEIRGNALLNSAADGIHMGNYGGTVRGNLLAANQGIGLDLAGTTGSVSMSGNSVLGNGLGNTATAGIRLDGTANSVLQNVLSDNQGAAVLALSGTSVSLISQNSMSGNGTLGIDLLSSADNPDRGTAAYASLNDNTDSDAGANTLLNFPVLTQAVTTGGNLVLTGYAPAGAVLEFFVPSVNAPGFGQGRTYLFSRTEGTAGNNSATDRDASRGSYSGIIHGVNQGQESNANRFLFSIPLTELTQAQRDLLAAGTYLTATATVAVSANRTTSEFSGTIQVQPNTPLPVTLVSFAAEAAGPDVRLNWRTAQEVNNAYFEVERSFDGRTFVAVGRLAGQGTSSQPRSYSLLDAAVARLAPAAVAYYRLRQIDTDGTAATTDVRVVRFGVTGNLSVFPSPTSADATLDLRSLPQGSYQVQAFDAAGRLVYSGRANGQTYAPLPAAQWPQGAYLIRVTGTGSTHTLRLVRQ
ncbi:right-handed parallel beta-helix repeat-containing protein [Hymenobacter yonginensis]|uniref:T9SS type A sorting domain-containing protein n=1 Tax=Hymenobacter yonginensis TaxID=748197 RepID=A0ABY7PKC8_9BACT|nr:right-handed parallel beta-helix repeat-containing protein [Hymenobacter yonginensis]WBO83688.1 T9SS type A sorting domain-containing protein [Hymenobacter yonginensis]